MKFWNMLGTLSRYVLAAVSCISLAQFLLLLNVGTENAGRLAGQSLGRGVITGLVAAVWFYRARKVSPRVPANVQTQTQLPPFEKSQGQPAPPPMDSVPITSPASVLTVDDSGSSFEQKELKAVIVVVVVGIVLFILMGTGVLHQPWTLSAGASQPRFIHIQGMPPDHMFDNRTAQTCTTDPIVYDSIERIEDDMRKFAVARGEEPHKLNFYYGYGYEGTKNAPLEKDDWQHLPSVGDPFIDRCNALKKNPLNPPVYHYDGMPYCKEL